MLPPLGVHASDDGVSVAVFSHHADAIELCLFDGDDREVERRRLVGRRDDIFHDHFDDLGPGLRYGLRALGPWAPDQGHRFNPSKLLIDPYARLLDRTPHVHASMLDTGNQPDVTDSAVHMAKGVICAPLTPSGSAAPSIAWQDGLIYETHVKGMTCQHPALPPNRRGRYAGLTHPAIIDHLVRLGVTAVELLPVQAFITEPRLLGLDLTNYWGYNTVGFFAPHPAYADPSGADARVEFRTMVDDLHAAGIEVILDVVYNHTGESDHQGPTLSLKGLDNQSYYRLMPDGRHYANPTGCGNALDTDHPFVLRLIMDSLRYWAFDMGVDGFRFDLGTTLARGPAQDDCPEGRFDPNAAFLSCLMQDPVLARKKMIFEPWDVGADGYQLGRFPPGSAEWNDGFRDSVRAFWRGDQHALPGLGAALAGSSTHFDHHGRAAQASANFVTSHDGFTLRDTVTYANKHNADNGEHNRDGHGHNISANYGHEGETTNPLIRRVRHKQARNLAATLFLAQGLPMWLGGDELLRTQKGNNNAYCQDNPISWFDWTLDEEQQSFFTFCCTLSALRRREPLLRQAGFLHDADRISWWHADGRAMHASDWHDKNGHSLGLLLADSDRRLLVLLNADVEPVMFELPRGDWQMLLSTAENWSQPSGDVIRIEDQSIAILEQNSAIDQVS